ncbi:hypothetical protein CRU96_05620 [Malaciobacter halophilus]|nr:antA/AntB antirepressor family protein [Malaciobacter halophilus]RYA23886.1 hypothetical protein CRU96_05620 [Malaciobacter halophilus]
MNELIQLNTTVIGTENVNSVNARDLHKFLEIKKDFSNWINNQIKSLGLEENVDYVVFSHKVKAGHGTTNRKEYIITTDTAKHISMASRTAKGKEARNYFIEVEKRYIENINLDSLHGRIGGLMNANNKYRMRIFELEEELKRLEPPKSYDDGFLNENMSLNEQIDFLIRQTEQELNRNTSRNDFFQNRATYWCNYAKVMRQGGNELQKFCIQMIEDSQRKRNEAYHKYVEIEEKHNKMLNQINDCCEKLTA